MRGPWPRACETTREVLCQIPRPQVRSLAWRGGGLRYWAEQERESGRSGCRPGEHEQISAVHDVSLADLVEQRLQGCVAGRVKVTMTSPRTRHVPSDVGRGDTPSGPGGKHG